MVLIYKQRLQTSHTKKDKRAISYTIDEGKSPYLREIQVAFSLGTCLKMLLFPRWDMLVPWRVEFPRNHGGSLIQRMSEHDLKKECRITMLFFVGK